MSRLSLSFLFLLVGGSAGAGELGDLLQGVLDHPQIRATARQSEVAHGHRQRPPALSPLAVADIGGLLLGTVLSLFYLPLFYVWVTDKMAAK